MEYIMKFAGVDYSLSSPAICIHQGEEWSYDNCTFYYYVKQKKLLQGEKGQYQATMYPDNWKTDQERYNMLGSWSQSKCFECDFVGIEGYAFGAVGRVFQIAENCGLFKHKLYEKGIPHEVYPPTMIKKFGSGKGNANKEFMIEAFEKEVSIDIREKCGIINKSWNPITDIVDAYFICKYGFYKQNGKLDDSNI
tara:strand:+ start:1964 stop:2545 length:582 start_codon:yes stop_codon:yes gene_type:complete